MVFSDGRLDFVELNNFEEAAHLDHDDNSDDESGAESDDEYGFDDGDFGF